MKAFDFYTIGYQGKSIIKFLKILKAVKARAVVDVRYSPVSHNIFFSKEVLEKALKANGIKYIHIKKLGVPKRIRDKLDKTKDYSWFFRWYDENVIAKNSDVLNSLMNIERPFVLMCYEDRANECHRSRIALWLKCNGLKGCNL